MKLTITKTSLVLFCAAIVSVSPARAEDEGEPTSIDKIPTAAAAAIKKYAGEGKIEKVVSEKSEKEVVYEALIKGPGKAVREVSVKADGSIESEEEVIELSAAPEKVRTAIQTQAKGGKVLKVERIKEDGKTEYEVEFEIDGKKSEVEFDEGGNVKPEEKEEAKKAEPNAR